MKSRVEVKGEKWISLREFYLAGVNVNNESTSRTSLDDQTPQTTYKVRDLGIFDILRYTDW